LGPVRLSLIHRAPFKDLPMPVSMYLLALLVVAIFAAVLLFMIRSDRRGRQRKFDRARSLGFSPFDVDDSDLAEQIVRLHTATSSQQLELLHTFLRTEGELRFLLFDLVDTSDGISVLQEQAIAATSNRLNLPRFSIFPKVVEGGKLSKWGNRFLEKLFERRGGLIEIPNHPRFNERYFLVASNPTPVLEFLTPYRLSLLSGEPYQSIEAGGNILTYAQFSFQRASPSRAANLEANLAQARNLYQIFLPD
jgi:hypothetical protein